MKMLLKSHLRSVVTPNITRSPDSFSTVPPIVNADDWGNIVRDLETLRLFTRIKFHIPNVTPLTNLDEVMSLELSYCNSNEW